MHVRTTVAHDGCDSETSLLTWTLLIWTAQAAFDLFVWVLLIVLVVAHGYHPRHDHPTGHRSPPPGQHADLPPPTTPQASDLR